MRLRKKAFARSTSGQALLETALVLPMLLLLVLNAINFGYFFLVALNLAAAPRSGVEYSILGFATPGSLAMAFAGPATTTTTVSYLTYQDMAGALNASANAPVQVCSKILGVINPGTVNQSAECESFNGSASFPAASDPESPVFVLHRVDVTYTFTPLIPGTPFGVVLLPASICSSNGGIISCTFHRQVSMRAMD